MAELLNAYRQTGRTTRMLKHAMELMSQGISVYVVLATQKDIDLVKRDYSDVPCYHSVSQLFDVQRLIMRGQPPESICLVDHKVIEQHYGPFLRAYHQFDSDGVESQPDPEPIAAPDMLLLPAPNSVATKAEPSKPLEPESEEWDRIAGDLAMSYCPNIYPCRHCYYPVISGYCCTHCGSAEPE